MPLIVERAFRDWEYISERNKAERALRDSEKRYHLLFDSSPEAVVFMDTEGTIVDCSNSALQLYQRPKAEIVGRHITFFLTSESLPRFREDFPKVKRMEAVDGEVRIVRPDGSIIDVWRKVVPLSDKDGNFTGMLAHAHEITERKRAEEEKFQLEEQLRQSHKMESIGRLAGGIAHDFNNLLSIIIGHTQVALLNMKGSGPLRTKLEYILDAGERASDLTKQLLAFGRKQVLEIKELDLNMVVTDIKKILRSLIGEDINMVTMLDPSLDKVMADPSQIQQIIMNLTVNARDAMPGGGKLTIETANRILDEKFVRTHAGAKPGSYVMMAIRDTGCGMDVETVRQIFDPFFTTKEVGKGTGLGLSTVYGIVKQHNGNIWVISKPGEGATFEIYLPRVEEGFDFAAEPSVELISVCGSETILLVEDDMDVRLLCGNILAEYGYNVIEAGNGLEAIELARHYKDSIHMLLTDVIMPGMNGMELYERLAVERPDMKVLYMSGYTDEIVTRTGRLSPGVNFLQKPLSLQLLTRCVREILDG